MISPFAAHVTVAWFVRLYACRLSHMCTLLKPLDERDVIQQGHSTGSLMSSQVTLHFTGAPVSSREKETWRSEPQVRSDAHRQITLALLINLF